MKYKVLLFQPYLRQHILNFGKRLAKFDFIYETKSRYTYASMPTFEKEIERRKDISFLVRIRRLLGIPSIRIKFSAGADLLFTFGSLLITNRPYCVYIDTGLLLYNYDPVIARHPVARLLVSWMATRENCKRLIFMSEAGMKSFFATVRYSPRAEKILREKSTVIYPVVDVKPASPKKYQADLKLLFVGVFYMKGGLELAHAYEKLRQQWPNISLTVVTPVHTIHPADVRYLQSLAGVQLLNANLSKNQMNEVYRTHDLFVLPTYREGFGLVVLEAIAHGMSVIANDQYAIPEMVVDGSNGFLFRDHPLKDYEPQTYRMLGRFYNPKDFYGDLFRSQKEDKIKPVEDFLVASISKFLENPNLLEKLSKGSLELYRKKFDARKLSDQIEEVFLEAVATPDRSPRTRR